jgi:hypothetical protein
MGFSHDLCHPSASSTHAHSSPCVPPLFPVGPPYRFEFTSKRSGTVAVAFLAITPGSTFSVWRAAREPSSRFADLPRRCDTARPSPPCTNATRPIVGGHVSFAASRSCFTCVFPLVASDLVAEAASASSVASNSYFREVYHTLTFAPLPCCRTHQSSQHRSKSAPARSGIAVRSLKCRRPSAAKAKPHFPSPDPLGPLELNSSNEAVTERHAFATPARQGTEPSRSRYYANASRRPSTIQWRPSSSRSSSLSNSYMIPAP